MGEPCEKLPWDSEFFGVSIARAFPSQLDEATCDAMLAWCRGHRIDCLYFLCPLEDSSTQRLLAKADFRLVDVRVTLTRAGEAGVGDVQGPTRAAAIDDIPGLRTIASSSHRDGRFHADGHFDRARCNELYATWIENSVRGYADHVIVAEREDSPVGYVTLHVAAPSSQTGDHRTARIGLIGVHEDWRKQGIGRDLLRSAAQMLGAQGVSETAVVTAGKNVAALGLYKSEGFSTTNVSLWYHRWFLEGRR